MVNVVLSPCYKYKYLRKRSESQWALNVFCDLGTTVRMSPEMHTNQVSHVRVCYKSLQPVPDQWLENVVGVQAIVRLTPVGFSEHFPHCPRLLLMVYYPLALVYLGRAGMVVRALSTHKCGLGKI